MWKTFSILFVTALLAAAPALAEEWRLMGRHGGCQSLWDAAKRKDALKGVASPEDFAAKMRREGEAVKIKEIPGGGAVIVEAPGRGLSLIFMTAEGCRKR